MIQPSQRRSKVIQTCLKQSEWEHIKHFIELKGLGNVRDLLLLFTSYHQLQKRKLQENAQ